MDFRQPSLAAARWAATHLAPAVVELVHVLRRPQVPSFLRGLAGTLPGREIAVTTLAGVPHQALAGRAGEIEADLMVLGRDVLDGARGHSLERTIRSVEVPVLVLGAGAAKRPERIVAAVDASPLRNGVARCATRLALRFDAQLTLLHVLAEGLGVQVHRLTHAWLHGLCRTVGGETARVRTGVVEGTPGPSILAESRADTTLTVLGRSGADSPDPRRPGSATRLLLRAAAGPVLIVPSADAWRPRLSLLTGSQAEPISVA